MNQAEGEGAGADQQGEHRGDREAQPGKPQRPSSQSLEVDLHSREEEQEGQSEDGENLHRQIDPGSTSPAGSETKKVFPSSTVRSPAMDLEY